MALGHKPIVTKPATEVRLKTMGMGILTYAKRPGRNFLHRLAKIVLFASLSALFSCSLVERRQLDRIKRAGEIRVLTYTSAATYYETPEGPTGFEYDLAKAFADRLGVRLRVIVADQFTDILPRLRNGDADFAAAGIADTEARRSEVRFTPPYHEIRQQVVYRSGTTPPTKIEELTGREIEVPTDSLYAERLQTLQESHPALSWLESRDKTSEDLLQLVWEGLLELTVADSTIIAVNRQYFPELEVAFDLSKQQPLAWAFPLSEDNSVYDVATDFIKEQRQAGVLAQLIDRYYGPAARSNFINLAVYRDRIQNRLPQYQQLMEDAAKKYDIDWRMLAAVAYQESYWDPTQVSPTGVRGLMMLTHDTAEELGIVDLKDPAQSIDGGARYLRQLIDNVPERIPLPDRLWFALAAYNVGPAHLEDARVLTQQQGKDPDKWNDVKERLPLLAEPQWYLKAKYGYCRGDEPVLFVNRVRAYHDILAKIDDEERTKRVTHALHFKAPAI
ncbi:MAG: membrane-bound lytic murein transglycosylase MltF [Gammaproteobacteria bacterium]|nr:membrane-bound lytic murein transglycosylase MltF [Gammaproteobacteria bacterium]